MLFDLLEKLRQKPDHTKRQIAFLTALLLAGIIFAIWLSVIYPDFRHIQAKEEQVSKLEPSPLATFGQTFITGISAMEEEFGKLKNSILSTISTDAIYYSTTTDSLIISTTTPNLLE
jgi:hypothetical protein